MTILSKFNIPILFTITPINNEVISDGVISLNCSVKLYFSNFLFAYAFTKLDTILVNTLPMAIKYIPNGIVVIGIPIHIIFYFFNF